MSNYILELKSVSSSNFKILFDVLKTILVRDINLIFTKDYMCITEVDKLNKVLVHLKVESGAFQRYNYNSDEPMIKIGVNPDKIFKVIKVSSTSDTITFLIKKNNPDKLFLRFENSMKRKVFESSITLLNLSKDVPDLPSFNYSHEITLSSIELHNTFKNINSLGDFHIEVAITKINSQLIFEHKGNFSIQKVIYELEDVENDNIIVQGTYDLKYLLLLTKSHKINTEVELFVDNNKPLMMVYHVDGLGELKLILSQNEQTLDF